MKLEITFKWKIKISLATFYINMIIQTIAGTLKFYFKIYLWISKSILDQFGMFTSVLNFDTYTVHRKYTGLRKKLAYIHVYCVQLLEVFFEIALTLSKKIKKC